MRNNFFIILSLIFFIFSLQNYSYSQNIFDELKKVTDQIQKDLEKSDTKQNSPVTTTPINKPTSTTTPSPKPPDSTNSIEHLFTLFGVKLGSDISTVPNIKFITEVRQPEIIRKASFTPKLKNELIGNYYVYFYPLSKTIHRVEGESKQTFPLFDENGCKKLELYSAYNYLHQKIIKESQGVIKGYSVRGFDFDIDKKKQAVKNFKEIHLNYRCDPVTPISSPLKAAGIISLSSDFNPFKEGQEEDIIKANKTKQKEKDLKESGNFKNF